MSKLSRDIQIYLIGCSHINLCGLQSRTAKVHHESQSNQRKCQRSKRNAGTKLCQASFPIRTSRFGSNMSSASATALPLALVLSNCMNVSRGFKKPLSNWKSLSSKRHDHLALLISHSTAFGP
jgi:hypothetical protein